MQQISTFLTIFFTKKHRAFEQASHTKEVKYSAVLEITALRTNTYLTSFTPLVNSRVDNVLVTPVPELNRLVFQLSMLWMSVW